MTESVTPILTTPDKAELYRTALEMLNRSGVPYMVGGTYAFQYYAGISRSTKDFDIFLRARDLNRILDALQRAGFKTEVAFSHWLAFSWVVIASPRGRRCAPCAPAGCRCLARCPAN